MFERLEQMEAKYEELNRASRIARGDRERLCQVPEDSEGALRSMTGIVQKYREYKDLTRGIKESRQMVAEETDPEMKAYAQSGTAGTGTARGAVEEELKVLLLPKDPNDEKNIIVEIRAGTGGDEASLFAAEIFRMYTVTRKPSVGRWKCCRRRSRAWAG